MKALLLAAGLGTRLKPFTDHHPKALARVNGKSLLEINIRNLQRFGIRDVVVNVHHFAGQITEMLRNENGFGSRVEISDESDAVLETGGGLKKAAPFFLNEKTFLVMNVDILSNFNLEEMVRQHRLSGGLATLAVQQRASSRYFLWDRQMRLRGWENVSTGDRNIPPVDPGLAPVKPGSLIPLAFSGIQLLERGIFDKIGRDGKFSLVDIYLDLCGREHIQGWDHTGDLLLDVGKPESLALAGQIFTC